MEDFFSHNNPELNYFAKLNNSPQYVINNNDKNPANVSLQQNYPNPFNPLTTIEFSVSHMQSGSPVVLKVFDILGNEITTLVDIPEAIPGNYSTEWNAFSQPSGIYFLKMISHNYTETKRMVLTK